MKHAFNSGGILHDVVSTDPFILFPETYASRFIKVQNDAENGWVWDGEKFSPPPVQHDKELSQFEIDQARYSKRAAVKDDLIALIAADNMSRVRSGQWTVAELTGLMSDPDVSAATSYMGTLSYELAAQAIASAQTPLLTPEIKSALVSKLQQHFYLTP